MSQVKPRYKPVGNDVNEKRTCGSLAQQIVYNLYGLFIIGIFIVFLVGANDSTSAMMRKMDDLNAPIQNLLGNSKSLLGTLPDGQLESSLKQVFDIVSNVKQITGSIGDQNIKSLIEKLDNALASVHGSDIAQFASVAEHANLLMSQVDMIRINKLMDAVTKLNPDLLNKLVESTNAIEQRLKDLHEIKIQI